MALAEDRLSGAPRSPALHHVKVAVAGHVSSGKKSASGEKRSELGRIGRRHLATFLAITLTQTTFSKNERIEGHDPLGARASTSVEANSSATARCSGFMTQQRKTVVWSLSTISASSAVASHSLFT